jgi:ADP-heptose:LPS heptosyltransferase
MTGCEADGQVRAPRGSRAATGSRRRLLVLRALGLGDLLAGVPALKALRRAFRDHEVVLALPPGLREAALATGAVDTVLPTYAPGREVPDLSHWPWPPPDVAVDLHGNGPASRDALAALSPRRLLAFAEPSPLTPLWQADEHERARWCRFLGAYGIDASPDDVRLPPPQASSPAPGAVVVHPGAASASRRWPSDRYAGVVGRLRARGLRVVLTGGPGEERLLAHIAASTGLRASDVYSGGLAFGDFAALVAGCAVLISGDTGPAHLAVALGTPSVTLFGPLSPALWGPPAGGRHVALWHPGPPGDPHASSTDPRLLRIGTAEVAGAVVRLAKEVRHAVG